MQGMNEAEHRPSLHRCTSVRCGQANLGLAVQAKRQAPPTRRLSESGYLKISLFYSTTMCAYDTAVHHIT